MSCDYYFMQGIIFAIRVQLTYNYAGTVLCNMIGQLNKLTETNL